MKGTFVSTWNHEIKLAFTVKWQGEGFNALTAAYLHDNEDEYMKLLKHNEHFYSYAKLWYLQSTCFVQNCMNNVKKTWHQSGSYICNADLNENDKELPFSLKQLLMKVFYIWAKIGDLNIICVVKTI